MSDTIKVKLQMLLIPIDDRKICACGSHPALCNWNADNAPELTPLTPCLYQFVFEANRNDRIEFKYVYKHSSGQIEWETGDNRIIDVAQISSTKQRNEIVHRDNMVENDGSQAVTYDPWLLCCKEGLKERWAKYQELQSKIGSSNNEGINGLSNAMNFFGFHEIENGLVYREWLPNVSKASLIGDFNGNDANNCVGVCTDNDIYEFRIPNNEDGSNNLINNPSHLLISIESSENNYNKCPIMPCYFIENDIRYGYYEKSNYTMSNDETTTSDQEESNNRSRRIYKMNIGEISINDNEKNFNYTKDVVLPHIIDMKYNTVELSKLFDCNSQNMIGFNHNYGTIDELKGLINACHNNNIKVIVDVNHYTVEKDQILPSSYFNHSDDKYNYYDYSKIEVIKMLLSQLRYLMNDYCVDGFVFDNVTGIIHRNIDTSKLFYAGKNIPESVNVHLDGVIYLMTVNSHLTTLKKTIITIADERTGYPTICRNVENNGIGFKYRYCNKSYDVWRKFINLPTNKWKITYLANCISVRRFGEYQITYLNNDEVNNNLVNGFAKNSLDENITQDQIKLYNIVQMCNMCIGGEGYMTYQGSEYGNPGKTNSGINWDILKNNDRYFHCLADMAKAINDLDDSNGFIGGKGGKLLYISDNDGIMIFERDCYLLVVNLSSEKNLDNYAVGVLKEGKYQYVLSSDDNRFGGNGRVNEFTVDTQNQETHKRPHTINIPLVPCLSAMILKYEKN